MAITLLEGATFLPAPDPIAHLGSGFLSAMESESENLQSAGEVYWFEVSPQTAWLSVCSYHLAL